MNWRASGRAVGLVALVTGALLIGTGLAEPAGWTDIAFLAAPDPTPSASPSPRASPPSDRGGPISLSIIGNLIAGKSFSSGTTGGQTGSLEDAGAVIDVQRRTPNTAVDVTLPASLSGNGSTLGQLSAEYDTVKNSYLYGPQQVGAIGLVPAGTTARGPAVLLPRKHGDLSLYAGIVGGSPSYLVRGARLRTIGHGGVSTIAAYQASTKDGGSVEGALLGLISRPGRTSGELEFGFERHTGIGDDVTGIAVPNGTSFALESRIDTGGARGYLTLNLRDISPDYVALGGTTQADRYAGLSYRAKAGVVPYTLTLEQDRTGDVGSVSNVYRESLALNGPIGKVGNAVVSLTNQSSQQPGDVTSNENGSFSIAYPFRLATMTLGAAVARGTDSNEAPSSSTSYQLGFSRTIGPFGLVLDGSYDRSLSPGNDDRAPSLTLGITRASAKSSISLSTVVGRQFQPDSAQSYITPTLSVSRRLSNVFVATVNAALQFRRDPLQPSTDGHSLQFSFSLGAPFAIGNGIVSGRPNPKLPGTISGVVQSDSTAGYGLSSTSALGAANIAVVLDDQRVVRTDVQGRFSFRFLPAGSHQITIDPSSLPRGVQPASPITTVQLQGGQLVTLVLGIGSYGSIIGSVIGGNSAATPISGVLVVLDGKTRALTDRTGTFAFGGLAAGPHAIAIAPETFPATFGLTPDALVQKVVVATGESTRVRFIGAPLGSIGGRLTYATGMDHAGEGVANAYVVANPGDHAAITDDDGTYLLDNLPPGTYTLSVDPETLPDGLAVTSDAQISVDLSHSGHIDGMNFVIGEGEKGVVFTYQGNESNVVTARAITPRLPPGGSAEVLVKTSLVSTKVLASAFGISKPLHYVAALKAWTGYVHIPANAPSGPVSISIEAQGKASGSSFAGVVVDPSIPIASLVLDPRSPVPGQYVHVRSHFLVDANAGDKIIWQDGAVTRLPKPRTGRYFDFDVKVTSIPFRGSLITATGQLPLTLVK